VSAAAGTSRRGKADPKPSPVVPDTPEQETMPVAPEGFRERFSADTAADYSLLRAAVRSAMEAKKTLSISCKHCGRSSKVEVADHRAAIDASRFAFEAGFGKPAQEKRDDAGLDRVAARSARWGADVYDMTPAQRSEQWAKLYAWRPWFVGLGRLDPTELAALLLLEAEQLEAEQADGKPRPSWTDILDAVTGELPPTERPAWDFSGPDEREQLDELVARHDETVRYLQQLVALKKVAECAFVKGSEELFPITEIPPHLQRPEAATA